MSIPASSAPSEPEPERNPDAASARSGSVQSVARTFAVLDAIADAGGSAGLSAIASAAGLAESTTHRLLATLVELGVVRRLPDRAGYALGVRLVRLGGAATPALGAAVRPVLEGLVDDLGESANLAMLVGAQAEYVAQVPSRHSMRMFTEVGRRVDLHCTGVGKAMLSTLDPERAARLIAQASLPARTTHTITDRTALTDAVAQTRERGYCLDEQEQEIGVRCVAVPIPGSSAPSYAVSVSGPLPRMTDDLIARAVPALHAAARRIAVALES